MNITGETGINIMEIFIPKFLKIILLAHINSTKFGTKIQIH